MSESRLLIKFLKIPNWSPEMSAAVGILELVMNLVFSFIIRYFLMIFMSLSDWFTWCCHTSLLACKECFLKPFTSTSVVSINKARECLEFKFHALLFFSWALHRLPCWKSQTLAEVNIDANVFSNQHHPTLTTSLDLSAWWCILLRETEIMRSDIYKKQGISLVQVVGDQGFFQDLC